jgi:hypothetical protein
MPREAALETLSLDVGAHLPTFTRSSNQLRELRADLRVLTTPILLLFDMYENASAEARNLVQVLLADLEATKALCIIVAGQNIPDHTKTVWAKSVQSFSLGKISDSSHWVQYAQRHHPGLNPNEVKLLTDAGSGTPGLISTLMLSLSESRRT